MLSGGMRIRAVAFDLDGLMFNTEDLYEIVGDELMRRRGLTMTDELRRGMMGRRPPEALRHLVERTGLSDPVERLQSESKEIFRSLFDGRLRPMPGLFELLDLLERMGLPKGVATSSPRGLLEELLGRFELGPRFAATVAAEDVARGKPEPDVYLLAAERLGVRPAELLVLEDSEAGTRAGAAAGARVVSVPHRHTASHDFSAAALVATGLGDPRIGGLLGG
jgi:HAD superfamily hydrolase (TIGR01509 family)